MNAGIIFILKSIRKVYQIVLPSSKHTVVCNEDPDSVSLIISNLLKSDNPCMIARFGRTELTCLLNYMGKTKHKNQFFSFIKGTTPPWWWQKSIMKQMQVFSGFFPTTEEKIEQFCKLMLIDIPEVDVLGFNHIDEIYFDKLLSTHEKINFELLNPYFSKIPWTKELEGKKVLVVHPFASTIESQYQKRQLLFPNNLLPAFELHTIKAIQTIAGVKSNFSDWFEALEFMQQQIDNIDYDICLIGCGAYGFALAAHVKRKGKKAIHLGGSLQLLFGIRGKRWERENYNPTYNYVRLLNENWVKPGDAEKPAGADQVEGACYW